MAPVSFRLSRVAALLFFSGACALVYQVAWFRELRLIFGASTAASAAVLAVFMGGLGVGGAVLGKRADASDNPLAMYARLELLVAVTAGVTPVLVWLAQAAYLGIGGASTLGNAGATVVRLLLSVVVLAPSTVLMGGTLPAAAKAVERAADLGRQRVAALYGVNTMGAVAGAVAANFLLLEVFGTRLTLWLACLVNALLAMAARAMARGEAACEPAPEAEAEAGAKEAEAKAEEVPALPPALRWFPPTAAAVAGLSFMLMELVWYRMLAPILGGSSYTFGLILAVALVGIGIGGGIYARTRAPATLLLFAMTCTLEALAISVPYALGDDLAILSLLLRPLSKASFGGAILAWTLVASIVVLPAAIVSGFQFPAIIGLYGRGSKGVGRDVGNAYLANTIGSIVGSIAGGFGLLPLLSAPRCWQLVAALLVATAVLALVLDVRLRGVAVPRVAATVTTALAATAALFATGPTAAWRHSGIGAGRADSKVDGMDLQAMEQFLRFWRSSIAWEADGLESTVALGSFDGHVFILNGKADGHALGDSSTQVMSGILPALMHDNPRRTLVVGLGTGSTAGWLGAIPSMERVDVVELEPAILRVARDCAAVNQNVMDNPKVHIQLADARESLRTTRERYDIIFSEPSNPYRAGISSMYTVEYYTAASERLEPNGIFVQWLQAYEVDPWAVATTLMTVRAVFPAVTLWETMGGDLLVVAERAPAPVDLDRMRERLKQEPYATAALSAWRTRSVEGILSHFVANASFTELLAQQQLGVVNHDDQNLLEFAFARNVGRHTRVDFEIKRLAARLELDRPVVKGEYDEGLVIEERMLTQILNQDPVDPFVPNPPRRVLEFGRALARFQRGDWTGGLRTWNALGRTPRGYHEIPIVAEGLARAGDPRAPAFIEGVASTAEQELLRAIYTARAGGGPDTEEEITGMLEKGFALMRTDPWVRGSTSGEALQLALRLGARNPGRASRLSKALAEPFSVDALRRKRLNARVALARWSRNPQLCIEALEASAPLPLERMLYETRVVCYREVNDPRLPEAERELAKLLGYELTFGSGIPSPPPPVPKAGPAPEDPSTDAAAPGEPTAAEAGADLDAAAAAITPEAGTGPAARPTTPAADGAAPAQPADGGPR